ncbi:stromal membrane-associated protein 1-like [Lingula anatina]|uniref:Stromal membrane-associated protein 1-like n=1 Tax=Lingula anatina TaxID=7574 RepID=A0A1S3KH37_LINAN|nr:stromal membrane-associated protein 1-like [Lingula anatina]|eukprot:XP_013421802.1 stromal membrane-associated protein 1-like [Lingula anatina]
MASRSERDKQKALQERHQAILSGLLKDDDNKYCVDCDAKGPRWASWNIGVFLCIRCAGIHRNLGVHISKVKSVNLDTWTPEQIAMMQEMGNSRGRAVYEAYLPDNFRRPQTDSPLEHFIRDKYERKKYMAKEWVPPRPALAVSAVEDENKKKKERPKPKANPVQLNATARPNSSAKPAGAVMTNGEVSAAKQEPPKAKQASNTDDLLGLDTPSAPASSSSSDLFGDFLGGPPSQSQPTQQQQPQTEAQQNNDLFGDSLLKDNTNNVEEKSKSTKESILALYGSGAPPPQQQMFGVPGQS